jgi:hypothetical protein
MKKFVRVRTVMYSDLEVETDNLPSETDDDVRTHVADWTVDELAAKATYFEHNILAIKDTELELDEH